MLGIRIWRIFICDAIELATALKCQKQLLMSSISNLGGRESLEIAVKAKKLERKHVFIRFPHVEQQQQQHHQQQQFNANHFSHIS